MILLDNKHLYKYVFIIIISIIIIMNTIEFLKEKRFNLVNKQKEIKNTLNALSMIGQPEDIIMLKLILNEVKRLRKTYNFLICNYDVIKTLILN